MKMAEENKKKITDSDILYAMTMHLDEDSVVFGANGHYSVGGYYDVLGDNYNKQSILDKASGSSEYWYDSVREELKDANWMKEY